MTMMPETPVLLARGGFDIDRFETNGPSSTKYSGLLDPIGVEELGRRLADAVRPYAANVVVIWEDIEDILLAHVVARELSIGVVRAFDADGLVDVTGSFPSGTRAAILTDVVRYEAPLRAVEELVRQQGGQIVVMAMLVGDGRNATERSWPVVGLVDAADLIPGGSADA